MTAPTLLLEHDGSWLRLWLRYIEGTRPELHDRRSLVGGYEPLVRPNGPGRVLITLDRKSAPLGYYLCGVSRGGPAHDLHVAFTAGPGLVKVESTGPCRASVTAYGALPVETDLVGEADWRVARHAVTLDLALRG